MAKIVECASLCCVPGGRDPIMATLQADGFTLESMNPARAATPMSVAAHSLYEQADPHRIIEPEGVAVVAPVPPATPEPEAVPDPFENVEVLEEIEEEVVVGAHGPGWCLWEERGGTLGSEFFGVGRTSHKIENQA